MHILLQCFIGEKPCKNAEITGEQSVKLRSDSSKFKILFKQLAVPFKIYADFESVLKRVHNDDKNNYTYTKKHQ